MLSLICFIITKRIGVSERIGIIITAIYTISSRVTTIFLLLLMPLYLYFIYIKLDSPNAISYTMVLSVIFILYLPIQVIASEKDIPVTFNLVYDDDDILKVVANSFLCVVALIIMQFYYSTGTVIFYLSWIVLQIQLYLIFKKANLFNKAKILFVLTSIMVILSYQFFSSLSRITTSFSLETFFVLFYILFQFMILTVVLFPVIGLVVFSKILLLLSRKNNFNINIDGLFVLMTTILVMYFFLLYLTNTVINSFSSSNIAFFTVYSFIILSSIGAYFQFKLFWSYFLEEKTSWIVTILSLVLFISILSIIVNVTGLIEKRDQLIIQSQQDFNKFYQNKIQ